MIELLNIAMVLNFLFAILVGAGTIMYICPKQKDSFINSIKVGFLILVIGIPMLVGMTFTQVDLIHERYNHILEKCYNNNIALDIKFKADIDALKIKKFKEKL